MEFSGTVKTVEANTAASVMVSVNDSVTIPASSSTFTVGNNTWNIEGESEYGGNVIHGSIEASSYLFVICRGTKKIAGLVYPDNPGDGSDPGTWEADEAGKPPHRREKE